MPKMPLVFKNIVDHLTASSNSSGHQDGIVDLAGEFTGWTGSGCFPEKTEAGESMSEFVFNAQGNLLDTAFLRVDNPDGSSLINIDIQCRSVKTAAGSYQKQCFELDLSTPGTGNGKLLATCEEGDNKCANPLTYLKERILSDI